MNASRIGESPQIPVLLFTEDLSGRHTVCQEISVSEEWFNKHFGSGKLETSPAANEQDWHTTGGITHSQVVVAGGFTVYYGPEFNEQSVHIGVGQVAIFQDGKGRGHRSVTDAIKLGHKVGCRRYHGKSDIRVP